MNYLTLTKDQLQNRRDEIESDILAQWSENPGYECYYVQCACKYDCHCEESVPRLTLEKCYYNAEFNFLTIRQPFLATHGFKIIWCCLGLD